ncbi:MAG: MFS transporter [Oscillospiraceae bacterium]
MKEKTKSAPRQESTLPRSLRTFYGIGEFGQQCSVITLNMFLLYFYTDILGISAAAAGTLLLVARIWDAINDPMMGLVIDRTHSKHGKCRPYLLFFAIPAGLFLFLTFFAPDMGNTAKLVWAYVTYIGQGMIYTATGISYTTLIARITDDPLERVGLNQSRAFISMFAAIFISSMTMPLITAIGKGNEKLGFAVTVGVYGILQAMSYLFVFFLTKGHDPQEPRLEKAAGQSSSEIKLALKGILQNDLWRLLLCATLLYCTSSALTQGILVYYVKYYLGRPELVGVASLFSMVSSFLAIVLLKVFAKHLGKARSCAAGLCIAVVCLCIRLFTRDAFIPVYLGCLMVAGFGVGLYSSLMVPVLMDSIDYGEWKSGTRNDALVMSANSFGTKLGSGIGSSLVAFMLSAIGYIPKVAVQPESVKNGLFGVAIFVPLTVFCINIVIMLIYRKYEKRMPAIRKELAEKHAKQAELLAQQQAQTAQ